MANQHGGRRNEAAARNGKRVGRPPRAPAERAPTRPMFPLRVEQGLLDAYRAADSATQATARAAMVAALRAALEEVRK